MLSRRAGLSATAGLSCILWCRCDNYVNNILLLQLFCVRVRSESEGTAPAVSYIHSFVIFVDLFVIRLSIM